MARQIKNFWLKIGTMFMTLYFMPLSHFIMSMFGRNASDANAGTIYCNSTNGPKINCAGVSDKTLNLGETVTCPCPTDSTKVQDHTCTEFTWQTWDDMCSCMTEMRNTIFTSLECYSKSACSPNGSTQDCSNTSQYGTSTCTNGQWGKCVMGNCKNGYVKVGSSCIASCEIENGTGYEYEEASTSSSSTNA